MEDALQRPGAQRHDRPGDPAEARAVGDRCERRNLEKPRRGCQTVIRSGERNCRRGEGGGDRGVQPEMERETGFEPATLSLEG